MAETPNPYQAPTTAIGVTSWWARLWQRLRPFVLKSRFDKGDAILCYGVVYLIDPQDPSVLHAALPSSEFSPHRMQALVDEAIRVLPYFLMTNPESHDLLRGRKLCVRMIEMYATINSECFPRVTLESDVVDAALSKSKAMSADPEHSATVRPPDDGTTFDYEDE